MHWSKYFLSFWDLKSQKQEKLSKKILNSDEKIIVYIHFGKLGYLKFSWEDSSFLKININLLPILRVNIIVWSCLTGKL